MDIQQILIQLGGNEAFCSTIYNSPIPCLGVKIPQLRTLAKQLSLDEALQLPYGKLVEYNIVKGLCIVNSKLPFQQKTELLTDFASHIDSWATCDTCIIKVDKQNAKQYFDYFCQLTNSALPFCVRYGLVNIMRNYLCEEYMSKVLDIIAKVKYGHYYVNMAVAWLIAELAVEYSDVAKQVLTQGVLPQDVVKYAKQKMRDSRRVDKHTKQWTYQ